MYYVKFEMKRYVHKIHLLTSVLQYLLSKLIPCVKIKNRQNIKVKKKNSYKIQPEISPSSPPPSQK